MNLEKTLQRIRYLMSLFVTNIKAATAMEQTDINKVSENVVIPLFAQVYGYKNLKNLNFSEGSNFPSIDLGDEIARVAFQITSTSGIEKVKHTLKKFIEYKLYEKYDRLIIYILTEKQKTYSDTETNKIIQGKFQFDTRKDIWDSRNILETVSGFSIEQAREAEKILEANFGESRRQPEWEVIDKIEDIINEYTRLFVGRFKETQALDNFLSENFSGVMLITAEAGFGKTALLANWLKSRRQNDYFIAYHFFSQHHEKTRSAKSAYRNLLRQLYNYYEIYHEQPPSEVDELRAALYNILKERGAKQDKPLIIIVESLDELNEIDIPFSLPFPTPLPNNVFVIGSARASEAEEPKYLENWIEESRKLHLKRLSKVALADWLKQTGEGELAIFADDNNFVTQLDKITEGFPLYVSYLTDELSHAAKQGKDVRLILAETPQGFEKYVKQQLKRLDEIELPDERWQFFALLAVAKGVLDKNDVKAITQIRDRQLRRLHQCWQVTRWMKITEGKYYAFAHPLLGTVFAKELGDDADDALQKLIDYCSDWQKHQSSYAVRHYPEHLRDEERWDDLYGLARNRDFTEKQSEQLLNEPDLPLKTMQLALSCAIEEDNPALMAEFMLLHARWIEDTKVKESPLDALRKGSLERALKLVEIYEVERQILWYLLLVWELKDTGKLDKAQEILKSLHNKDLFCYRIQKAYWQGDYAAYFLAHIYEVDNTICKNLQNKILDDNYRRHLYKYLADLNKFIEAENIIFTIKLDDLYKIYGLTYIAEVQAKQSDKRAIANFNKALDITRKPCDKILYLAEIIMIGEAQVNVGYIEAAIATFKEAQKIALSIANISEREYILNKLEKHIATAKHYTKSTQIHTDRINTSQSNQNHSFIKTNSKIDHLEKYRDNHDKTEFFIVNIRRLAENRNFSDEFAIQEKIKDEHKLEDIICQTALSLAGEQQYDAAIDFASIIQQTDRRAKIQGRIAISQVERNSKSAARGNFATALRIAQESINTFIYARTLAFIGVIQVKNQQFQQGINTAKDVDNIVKNIENLRHQAILLARVAEAFALAGKIDESKSIFDKAKHIATSINNQQESSDSFRVIALTEASIKYFYAALKTAQKIELPWTRLEVFKAIARLQLEDGRREEALNTISDALNFKSYSVQNERINIFCEKAVIEAAKDKQTAQETFNKLLKFARNSGIQKDEYLYKIATALVEVEEFYTALKVIDEIKDDFEIVRVLCTIAYKQFNKGEKVTTFDAAIKAKNQIQDEKKRLQALNLIAHIQVFAGKGEQAVRTIDSKLPDRNSHISGIASLFIQTGDKVNFKKLLIPCAYYLDASYRMCGYLSRLYPQNSQSIVEVVKNFS